MSASHPAPVPSDDAGDKDRLEDPRREAASRILGESLRRYRKERGLGLKDVAPVIRASISKMSRLERGESPPKPQDVLDLARFYRVTTKQQREIDTLLQQSQSSAWWNQYTDVTPSWLRRLIDLEIAATDIIIYETHLVPGLLQTPAYARAVVRAGLPQADEREIRMRVELREHRQRLLRGNQRPTVVAVLDEAVLHRPTGGPAVMAEQLRYLRSVEVGSGIHVRILRFEHGADIAPSYPITHLRFRDGGPAEMVYVEHMDSALYVTKPALVEQYRLVLTEARLKCARWDDCMTLLDEWIQRYAAQAAAG